MSKPYIVRALWVAAVLITIVWIGSRFYPPRVELSSVRSPPLTLRFRSVGINSIMGVTLCSATEHEYLWNVDMGRSNAIVDELTYGVVPSQCRQQFPQVGRPRPLKVGERILVEVSYQYDEWMSASAGESVWACEVESANKLKVLGRRPSGDMMPMPPELVRALRKEIGLD